MSEEPRDDATERFAMGVVLILLVLVLFSSFQPPWHLSYCRREPPAFAMPPMPPMPPKPPVPPVPPHAAFALPPHFVPPLPPLP